MFRDMFKGEHGFKGHGRESPFHKGDLKFIILDLLKEKQRYGYEVIRAFEEFSHGFYTPSPGVIYPTLQMLEEMGYASSADRDGKKVYTITGEGLKFLSESKNFTDEVKSQMKHRWQFKDMARMAGLMKELHILQRSIGHSLHHAEPEKMERVSDVISKAVKEVQAILEE
jgi:DNA-binding PadR family transcriptional regulator